MADKTDQAAAKTSFQTSFGERLSYGFYNFGQNLIYSFVTTYLMTFLLMRGLTNEAIALVLVVVKVWDAVNDVIFGGIVDKVRFKNGGKFMPWIRVSLVFIPIATVLMYAIPSDLSSTAKLIWLAVAYILWDTAYTVCDVPNFGLATTMTTVQNERTSIMAIGRLLGTVGAIMVTIGVPALVSEQVGMSFFSTSIIVSIAAILTMLPLAFKGKERVKTPPEEKGATVKEMLRYLVSNKYLLIICLSILILNGLNTAQGIYLFAAYYLFGDAMIATVIGALITIPVIIVGIFMPRIVKKVDKFVFYFWCLVVHTVISFVVYFAGYENITLHIVLLVLRGLFSVYMVMQFMFTPDCAEYGQYKTGIDAKGIAFAVQTFTAKLRAVVTSVLGVLILGWFGWQTVEADSFADIAAQGITQSAEAINGLWITYALIPAIGSLLTVGVLLMYKLRDKDVEVMARYNSGEITREECDAQLSRKY